jgi:hypothetical protein
VPGLVPLSFDWDGTEIMVVTPVGSPCGRNLRETGRARLGIGEFRDVVMVDASAREVSTDDVPEEQWQRYIVRTDWDPRTERADYAVYLLRPERIQAWREANEIPGRTLMRDGVWLA